MIAAATDFAPTSEALPEYKFMRFLLCCQPVFYSNRVLMHRSKTASLFDHLVGAAKQRDREGETERFGGLEIDREFDFHRLLDRPFGGPRTLKNPASGDTDQGASDDPDGTRALAA